MDNFSFWMFLQTTKLGQRWSKSTSSFLTTRYLVVVWGWGLWLWISCSSRVDTVQYIQFLIMGCTGTHHLAGLLIHPFIRSPSVTDLTLWAASISLIEKMGVIVCEPVCCCACQCVCGCKTEKSHIMQHFPIPLSLTHPVTPLLRFSYILPNKNFHRPPSTQWENRGLCFAQVVLKNQKKWPQILFDLEPI